VLVVDDDREMARGLKMVLELWGFDVAVAYDGPAAVAAARSLRPDVVLLDLALPGLDGLQIARAVREQQGSDVQLVALTGYDDDRHRSLSQDAGFDAHLVKPVDPDVLRKLLLGPGRVRISSNSG
jgi:DNA-binding response OmpR family regulator